MPTVVVYDERDQGGSRMKVEKVELVYLGRSGRFKHGKTYSTKFSSQGRIGIKSPSTWIFTLNRVFKNYRITPYEFNKYWEFKDRFEVYALLLNDLYKDSTDYMCRLVYNENPLLSMIPKSEQLGCYYPVPIIYGETE